MKNQKKNKCMYGLVLFVVLETLRRKSIDLMRTTKKNVLVTRFVFFLCPFLRLLFVPIISVFVLKEIDQE